MNRPERHAKILSLISENSAISVNELSRITKASQATIRRDLTELEGEGIIERFHGGAVFSDKKVFEISFDRRKNHFIEEKRAIAEAAIPFIEDDSTVILDAGTTALQIAKKLCELSRNVHLVTNSLAIANETAGCSEIDLTLLGGRIDWRNMATVGHVGVEYLRELKADLAFIGANAVYPCEGVFAVEENSALLNRAMVRSSKMVIVVCDSSKFHKEAHFRAVTPEQIDYIVTGSSTDRDILDALKEKGVAVIIAGKAY